MTSASILIVDDDRDLGEMLSEFLGKSNFTTKTAVDGLLAAELIARERFDLVILDVMLPSLNGFDVLKRIRRQVATPVIMLTARGEDSDCVLGLELGADDYLSKPFSLQQLGARVRAILRRTVKRPDGAGEAVSAGPVTLFPDTFGAHFDGKPLPLTGTEFRLLEILIRSMGQTKSREFLTEHVLGRALSPYDRSIDMHVSNLRRKLSPDPDTVIEIRNIRGAGYVLLVNAGSAT
jgi:two-component system response regulator CpxR